MAKTVENNIKKIQVFGAHCSGTNWVDALMQQNFMDVSFMRTDVDGGIDNFGWKHGPLGSGTRTYLDGREVRQVGERIIWPRRGINISVTDPRYTGLDTSGELFVKNRVLPLDKNNSSDTLLVVVRRNPMSWLQSFHQTPHHALEMYGESFEGYLRSRPFTLYNSVYIGAIRDDTPESRRAREHWIKRGVIIDSDNSVFAHRKRSLESVQAFAEQVQNVVYVPYERAFADPHGTLAEIAGVYGIQMAPEFADVTDYKRTGYGSGEFTGSRYDPVKPDDLEYVGSQLAWQSEARAGYTLKEPADFLASEYSENPASLIYINPAIQYYKNGPLIAAN